MYTSVFVCVCLVYMQVCVCMYMYQWICVKVYYIVCTCTAGDSVQSPPSSSTSQDGGESTPQLSVHSDTHQLSSGQLLVTLTWWWLLYMYSCTDTRTADHSSLFISLRKQTPHKPSGELCVHMDVHVPMCVCALLLVFSVCFGHTLLWLLCVFFSTKCGLYEITESLFQLLSKHPFEIPHVVLHNQRRST